MARQTRSKYLEIPVEWIDVAKARIKEHSKPNLNGCWEWQLPLNSWGYGYTSVGSHIRAAAHRIAYAAFKGPVPAGLVVCHECDNARCVNPNHLWIGTQEENAHDCMDKGRANFPQELEYCKRGLHKREGWNVIKSKKEKTDKYWRGGRQCRACKYESTKRYLERKKSATAA